MKNRKLIMLLTCFTAVIALTWISASDAAGLQGHPDMERFVRELAQKYNYNPESIRGILRKARYNPEVIQRVEKPYEAKPWYEYQRFFITNARIQDGVNYWNQSARLLTWQEREYRVPADIITAILGIESNYGKNMGHFRVLDALTTLAFHYPPRAQFFQQELAAFIVLIRMQGIQPESLSGSYAGAMGQPQFMPSTLLHYGVDFQGHGEAPNLFTDRADIIFSVGNYLRQHGWEPGQPIATPARLSGTRYQQLLKTESRVPSDPELSLKKLAEYGVFPASGSYDPQMKARLIQLQGKDGMEYWLTFHNFYVITTYSAHNYYAMAVYQLGKAIKQARAS